MRCTLCFQPTFLYWGAQCLKSEKRDVIALKPFGTSPDSTFTVVWRGESVEKLSENVTITVRTPRMLVNTPPRANFKADILDNVEGENTERRVR